MHVREDMGWGRMCGALVLHRRPTGGSRREPDGWVRVTGPSTLIKNGL
ncbi:mCG147540, partial [Mus musculus]